MGCSGLWGSGSRMGRGLRLTSVRCTGQTGQGQGHPQRARSPSATSKEDMCMHVCVACSCVEVLCSHVPMCDQSCARVTLYTHAHWHGGGIVSSLNPSQRPTDGLSHGVSYSRPCL